MANQFPGYMSPTGGAPPASSRNPATGGHPSRSPQTSSKGRPVTPISAQHGYAPGFRTEPIDHPPQPPYGSPRVPPPWFRPPRIPPEWQGPGGSRVTDPGYIIGDPMPPEEPMRPSWYGTRAAPSGPQFRPSLSGAITPEMLYGRV